MVERFIKRPHRLSLRRPLPPPPRDRPVPHTQKKPILASTGSKVERLCGICLGKLKPGVAITFCKCGKFFHLDCISEVKVCPMCQEEMEFSHIVVDEDDYNGVPADQGHEEEIVEEVFQCPICNEYVDEYAAECKCGAIFDAEEVIYTCPECGAEVDPESRGCENCGLVFD